MTYWSLISSHCKLFRKVRIYRIMEQHHKILDEKNVFITMSLSSGQRSGWEDKCKSSYFLFTVFDLSYSDINLDRDQWQKIATILKLLNSLDKMDKYIIVYRFLNCESLSSLHINTSSNDGIKNFKCVKIFFFICCNGPFILWQLIWIYEYRICGMVLPMNEQ